jgi:hypothetical protein
MAITRLKPPADELASEVVLCAALRVYRMSEDPRANFGNLGDMHVRERFDCKLINYS